jgi:UDP-N-acetylenolpyruvoylglucosamine reductase
MFCEAGAGQGQLREINKLKAESMNNLNNPTKIWTIGCCFKSPVSKTIA